MREIAKNYDVERINRQKIEDYLNKKNGLWNLVFKVVRLTAKNRNEIEDIASESLFKIWEKAGTCKHLVDLNNKGFRTWVAVITENKANLAGRKISRFRDKHILDSDYCDDEGNFSLEEFAVSEETPVSLVVKSEEKEIVAKMIPELPGCIKSVVEMFYYGGKKYREIAEELNVPIGTVKSRLNRAKGVLRKRLEGYLTATYN